MRRLALALLASTLLACGDVEPSADHCPVEEFYPRPTVGMIADCCAGELDLCLGPGEVQHCRLDAKGNCEVTVEPVDCCEPKEDQ